MGYPVFTGDLSDISQSGRAVVNTINQYSFCLAEKDAVFQKALKESDILLPDGIGIVVASRFLYGNKIQKIAGADLHAYLLEKLNRDKGSCFYMGSSEDTLIKLSARLTAEYPHIRVGTYSPPFKPEFSDADNFKIQQVVNDFRPDVLFVGMTAPKQEKWSRNQKSLLDAKLICSIGAVFDFYAGTVERPNKFWQNSGLEWLGRLIKEPKRMWKRYIVYGFVFGFYLLREKVTGQSQNQASKSM